jgi:hypothetical protein
MKKVSNKQYLLIGIAIILLIGAIFLFTQDSSGSVKTITHPYFNFSINNDWKETSSMSAFVYTHSSNENGEAITIVSTYLGTITFDLSLPLQQSIEGSIIQMPDLLVSKSGDWDNGKISGKEIGFTGTKQGVKILTDQIFATKNGVLYSITYTCTNACKNPDVFSKVKETFGPLS